LLKIPSALQKAALLCVSSVVALLFAELLLRLFVPIRAVGPSFTAYDPVYGKRLKESFSGERVTPEFTMRFSTNSYGFRGSEPQSFPEHPILFLGDSFTMGYGVNDGEEFPALIHKALMQRDGKEGTPIVNAGMGDNGQGWWLKFLRREGKRYHPRLLVLQICANDFEDNVRERLFEFSGADELQELQIPPISRVRRIQNCIDAVPCLAYSYVVGLGNQLRWLYATQHVFSSDQSEGHDVSNRDNLTLQLLESIIRMSEHEGWPMIVMIIGVEGSRLQALEKLFRQHYVMVICMPDKKARPDLYYHIDGHWNAQGHALAAEMILQELERIRMFTSIFTTPSLSKGKKYFSIKQYER